MANKELTRLDTLLNTICSDSVLKTVSEYHTFLQTLTQQCISDPTVDVLLAGTGYDYLPPFYKMFDFGNGRITARSRLGRQNVFIVYKNCVVLENATATHCEGLNVLLHATPATRYDPIFDTGKLILHISPTTHALIQRELFDTPFDKCIVVRFDDQQVAKFHMSSYIFEEMFEKDHSSLLLYQLPAVQLDLRQLLQKQNTRDSNRLSEEGSGLTDDSSLWYESQKQNIGAVKMIPGFECSQWPKCAEDWVSRNRIWPKKPLVQRVLGSKVLVVPSTEQISLLDDVSLPDREDIARKADDLLWIFNFNHAESILLSHITSDTRKVFFLLQALVNDPVLVYTALIHLLLWCVEVHGPDLGTKGSSLMDKLLLVISKLESFLSDGGVPHYFMSGTKILKSTDVDKVSMCGIIGTEKNCLYDILLANTGLATIANARDLTYCSNTLFKNLVTNLYATMEHNTRLLTIQLYRKLHKCDGPWKSIEIHHQVEKTLDMQTNVPYPKLHKAIKDFVQSSLGGVYILHGVKAHSAQERKTFFSKAEEQFIAVRNTNMLANKLRQGLILLSEEKYQCVLGVLQGMLDKQYAEILAAELVCPEDREADYETNVPFLNGLENATVYTMYNLDYLAMRMERSSLPRVISKNLSLAQYQLLGYTQHPVSLIDAAILCGVLMSYAYSGLKMYTEANQTLEKVESLSLKDEVDLNEKRGCFYLNVMSDAYMEANNTGQAKYLLQRSVKIMSNLRNPGQWALVSINTKKMRDYVWGGMGIAMATTIAAVTINFIFNRK